MVPKRHSVVREKVQYAELGHLSTGSTPKPLKKYKIQSVSTQSLHVYFCACCNTQTSHEKGDRSQTNSSNGSRSAINSADDRMTPTEINGNRVPIQRLAWSDKPPINAPRKFSAIRKLVASAADKPT